MAKLRSLWHRYLAWRNSPSSRPQPVAQERIKKYDVPDDEMGQFQRGLGYGEGQGHGG